jgi:hypothetical protein
LLALVLLPECRFILRGKKSSTTHGVVLLSEVSMWRGNSHGKSQMILTEYQLDHKTNKSRSVYLLRHNSRVRNTVLEQNLTVEMDNYGGFKPTISLDDFPRGLSEREAMLKLAEWLQRLSIAIEDNWSEP